MLELIEQEMQNGNVYVNRLGDLRLYCYTKNCVFNKAWNDITKICRGIIFDKHGNIIARPFPKFFNLGEEQGKLYDLPFTVLEKLDGSMITIYFYEGRWHCATKGSLNSTQAIWAEKELHSGKYNLGHLDEDYTYVCEAIYPENRIVVRYGNQETLVLLAVIHTKSGTDYTNEYQLWRTARDVGFDVPEDYDYNSIQELVKDVSQFDANREGVVIRYSNGERLKIKGDAYCALHRAISRVTPLAIWDMMVAAVNAEEQPTWAKIAQALGEYKKILPEEFWTDFDNINDILWDLLDEVVIQAQKAAVDADNLSNKELGLSNNPMKNWVFAIRNHGALLESKQTMLKILREIRPTANYLKGYVPSSSMNAILEDE